LWPLLAAEDGTIQLWYLRDGAPLHTLSGHVRSAAIAFHPDSSQLVSAGADDTYHLYVAGFRPIGAKNRQH
jgi:WD40 repeat protein